MWSYNTESFRTFSDGQFECCFKCFVSCMIRQAQFIKAAGDAKCTSYITPYTCMLCIHVWKCMEQSITCVSTIPINLVHTMWSSSKELKQAVCMQCESRRQCAYHVWAEGNRPAIGACDMVNLGFKAQNPSDGSCDDPVVNCSSLHKDNSKTGITQ